LIKAADTSGDKLGVSRWPNFTTGLIDSQIADMKNVGPREPVPSPPPVIKRFVDDGVFSPGAPRHRRHGLSDKAKPTYDKGATGYGVEAARPVYRRHGRGLTGNGARRLLSARRRAAGECHRRHRRQGANSSGC
jgi:hypothetical protein